jgi:hypothetical protein
VLLGGVGWKKEKARKNPGLTWRIAAETATAEARDAKQGPPRSEGVVPLEGEGAEGDSGGVSYRQIGLDALLVGIGPGGLVHETAALDDEQPVGHVHGK